ncbi:hypothetical protein P4C99_03295 [Pontiellaceae bacterium B1224]|nr:hypothetical protein [Pontiellaceae bacterium B1224]
MKYYFKTSLLGSLFLAGLFLVLVPASGEEAREKLEKPSTAVYSGSIWATYDYRGFGSYSDQDLYTYWYLRGQNLADNRVDVYTSGRYYQDLDGVGSSFSTDPFISLNDTSVDNATRMLQLYLELHDPKRTMALRIGRQYVDIADYIQMDGMQAMLFENKQLGGRVFGGKPVSYYSSVSGDLFGGISLVGKPWDGNRSRATYARYYDDSVGEADNNYFFDVRQQMGEEVRARSYLSVINEGVQMAGLDFYYTSFGEKVFDAVVGARYWGEFDAYTRVYSPLVQTLGAQNPYATAYGRFTSQLTSWLYLSPGAMLRYTDEPDYTNQGFGVYDLSFIFEPSEALSANISFEYWDVEDGDQFMGLSGDIRYRYRRIWDISLGAAYADYTYFQFSDFSLTADGGSTIVADDGTRVEVSPYSFTYFLRAKWNVGEHIVLSAAGEIEDDSEANDVGYRFRTSIGVRL